MPKVLTQGAAPSEEKSALSTVADWAGGLELAGDVTSLYGPASIIASPVAGIAGIVKDVARYSEGKQSGWTTAANVANHIGWGLLGMIPEVKGIKLLGKAGKAANATETAGKVAGKNSDELLKAYQQAEAKLAEAKKGTAWYRRSSTKALEEEVKLAKKAYEQSKKGASKASFLQDLLTPKSVALGVGRTATSGALTYGLPGMEQYIKENSDSEFTPGSAFRAIGSGAIGNGFNLLGQDIKNAPSDWGAASRLAGVFIQPHSKIGRNAGAGIKSMKRTPKAKVTPTPKQQPPKPQPKLLEAKTTVEGRGFTATTTGKVQKPTTKFKKNLRGGKLEIIKMLHQ